ncbi:MAG: hypothetical protein KGQ49_06830 [Verrucomicrobia bacterium]|nr:hypothetical protein [Verrucomicrobiota bacterium]MBU6447095.1 hypothetical protein [Verrucomicrobiota bacterium]
MKPKKLLFVSSSLALAMALASCASYSASPLYNPSPDLVHLAPKNEGISVVSKTFTRSDCDRFLDRDVLAEGYQPVQIYIQNDSDKNYVFSLNRITLPVARPEEVAEKVHTSTAGRAVGYGAAGVLIFLPLVIPAIVDGIKPSNANDALDNDFLAKAARDQVIFPHSRFNAIIFVPVHAYQPSYTITLIDQDSKQPKVFNIVSN